MDPTLPTARVAPSVSREGQDSSLVNDPYRGWGVPSLSSLPSLTLSKSTGRAEPRYIGNNKI